MPREKRHFKWILSSIFILLSIIIFLLFSIEKKYKVQQHLEHQSKLFHNIYKATYEGYHTLADTVYSAVLNKPYIVDIMAEAKNNSDYVTSREALYQYLLDDFHFLEKKFIRQIQFHLPNRVSFLRMHRPELFGDDLGKIRPTISYIAKTHQRIDSFEQGRLTNGFRFVYPLFKDNKYVGSVEISFSTLSILTKIMKDYDVLSNTLVKKNLADKYIENKEYYIKSPLEGFYFEKTVLEVLGNKFNLPKNVHEMRKKIGPRLKEKKLFSVYNRFQDRVITFIPVSHAVTDDLVAYVMLNSYSDYIYNKMMLSKVLMLLMIFLLGMILLFIYRENISKERLRISENKSRTILNASASMLIVWDKRRVVEANETFFRFFDTFVSIDDFNNKYNNFCGVFHPLEEENFISCALDKNEQWFNMIVDNNERTFKTAIAKNGRLYYFILHIKSTVISEKSMYLIELTDISNEMQLRTELKQKDVQLFHKHKMAQMGEMINTIAHQWRQPLAIINTLVAISKEKLLHDKLDAKDLVTKLTSIEESTAYMSTTIEDFLQFHKPAKSKESFSVNDMLEKTLKIIRPTLDVAAIEILFEEINMISMHGYERELSQVIVALLSNARDELLSRNIQNPWIKIILEEKEGYLYLSIEDNAGGIEDEMLLKVFEPYFSTKEQKQGSGLGLYISKMIIETSMSGNIDVNNTENGAKFSMRVKL